ncbi:U3 small nucleolar RNA-associated protein 25-like [Lycium barbarum]|uniref:U3 small nucleolar RNA-associated protein 25-like n=1 Tax=Lycium barbarum TaxID=112863 RepID=UPI00293EB72E|nr:U3 small nucleolar RNA-associated protein 25-like [Lycium barbarum]
MDRERRKRKTVENERSEEEEEEDEDEEEKIEKFFALIRSTKDIRDRLLARNHVVERPKNLEDNNTRASVDNNFHHPHDFMETDASATAGPSTSNSKKQQHKEEGREQEGEEENLGRKEGSSGEKNRNMLDLDLNLSL